jgi:hypothetical protein
MPQFDCQTREIKAQNLFGTGAALRATARANHAQPHAMAIAAAAETVAIARPIDIERRAFD